MAYVELLVGFDPFHAQVIADVCRDEGIDAKVLEYDYTRYELGLAGSAENKVVVGAADEVAARRIIADLYPEVVAGGSADFVPTPRRHSRRVKAIGYFMAAIFLVPLAVQAVLFVIRQLTG